MKIPQTKTGTLPLLSLVNTRLARYSGGERCNAGPTIRNRHNDHHVGGTGGGTTHRSMPQKPAELYREDRNIQLTAQQEADIQDTMGKSPNLEGVAETLPIPASEAVSSKRTRLKWSDEMNAHQ